MTAAHGGNGAASNGTDSAVAGVPANVVAGNGLVLDVAYYNDAGTPPPAPAGWTLIDSFWGGTGSPGSGTGLRGQAWYWKIAVGGETDVTVNNTGGSSTGRAMRAVMHRATKTLAHWHTPVAVGGQDVSIDQSWSITGDGNLLATVGDLIFIANVLAANTAITMSLTAFSVPGCAGTLTSRGNGLASGGHQVRLMEYSYAVTSGTETDVPVYTANLSAASSGIGHFLKLHDSATVETPAPTVNAGADQVNKEPWSTITIAPVGTPGGGSITSYSVTQTAGPAVSLSGTGTQNRTFSPEGQLVETTYTFSVTATQTDGQVSAPDTINITVLPANERAIIGGVQVPVQIKAVLPL